MAGRTAGADWRAAVIGGTSITRAPSPRSCARQLEGRLHVPGEALRIEQGGRAEEQLEVASLGDLAFQGPPRLARFPD